MSGEIVKKRRRAKSDAGAETPNESVRDFRERQACVSQILETVFGPLGECDPKLWRRRAYLLLIAIVYERLAVGQCGISTRELMDLANVLTRNDRAGGNGRTPKAGLKSRVRGVESGAALKEAVRELYGTNFR